MHVSHVLENIYPRCWTMFLLIRWLLWQSWNNEHKMQHFFARVHVGLCVCICVCQRNTVMNEGYDAIRDIFQSLEQMLLNLPSLLHTDYIKQARGVCKSQSVCLHLCVCVLDRKRGRGREGREQCRWGILTRLMEAQGLVANIFTVKKSTLCWLVKTCLRLNCVEFFVCEGVCGDEFISGKATTICNLIHESPWVGSKVKKWSCSMTRLWCWSHFGCKPRGNSHWVDRNVPAKRHSCKNIRNQKLSEC